MNGVQELWTLAITISYVNFPFISSAHKDFGHFYGKFSSCWYLIDFYD